MLRTELIRPLPEILAEHAARRGGRTAFADGRRRVTYAELDLRTRRIAGHLAALRVHPGDRVAIYLGNRVETVESYLAITRADAIGVPLNPHSSDAELEYFLDDSGARVVITDAAHADQLARVLGESGLPRLVITGGPQVPAGAVAFETLATTEPETPARDGLGLDEVAWMLYTSGTTGKPKGVLSTQRNCLWSVAAAYVPVPGLTAEDRVLWPLPLFHSLSHIAGVLAVTAVGASARITDGYAPDEILAALREESPTFLAGVPAMYHQLVQAARQQGVRAPHLRAGLVGGAVTTRALRASFEETFGVPLLDAYGSTETCGAITINWPTGARVEGSSGLPVPGLRVRLVDPETGRDVPAGAEGEVWVSGPNVMAGYHNRPEETAAALRDGWYRTGDLARQDEAGYVTVSGRIKDLIIRGGENIHPGEVEEVLRSVPGVADVAVAGRPHDILGEVPVAFLVPGPEGFDTDALFAACRERLAYFKVPEELYEVTRIPRTRSGKVTRRVLLDEPARLRAAGSGYHESLFRTDWLPLPSPAAAGTPAPYRWATAGEAAGALAEGIAAAGAGTAPEAESVADVTVLTVGGPAEETADPTGLLGTVAARVRDWAAGAGAEARLLVVTRGAVPVRPDETPDPASAAVAGLLRGLGGAYGDRLVHVDSDALDAATGRLLPAALATGRARLAVRTGSLLAPALERLAVDARAGGPLDPTGTLVVVGAGTPAGAAAARHLVAGHHLRRVLLLAEQGEADPVVAELAAGLRASRAKVTVAGHTPGDRAALDTALAGVRHPVAAVVHAVSGPPEAVAADVPALDELTADARYVLLTPAPPPLGGHRPAEEAAVAALAEAVAVRRAARGRAALALAVGAWAEHPEEATGAVAGTGTLTRRELLAVLDSALLSGESAAVALKLDTTAPHEDAVPAELRGLIDTTEVAADAGRAGELRARLAASPAADRLETLEATVSAVAAEVIGAARSRLAPDKAFKELGFTSVQAVQLRNRLVETTGLALPATLAFDRPTPGAVARFLLGELTGTAAEESPALAAVPVDDDPIVIVGMAVRLPGGINGPEELWDFVDQGLDGITPFPADRGWNLEDLYDPDPEQSGTTYVRDGGFLSDAAGFDAAFFGISPREALAMDPQQRVFLETSWEVFERASIDVTDLRGSRTGVFAGAMNQDYGMGLAQAVEDTEGYQSTGTAVSVVSGRVAYTFGFEGPAVTVDTACSSSLVALHLAAQSLRSGESDLALVGGVAVMSRPGSFVEFARQRGLAPDGRPKPFAAAADGTGWAEGAAVVLVERLSDARRNGHTVLAVVRGTAVNQDGASNGLTAPNGPSQQRVIRQALGNAGLGPADVDAVEAHGTGTTLGDPIEAQALINTYGKDRDPEHPLWLGSLKSNIGHTQAAAGVAGVVKSILAMRHDRLPRTLHVDAPTPHVDWSAGTVRLLTDAVEWPRDGRPRRIGVSAFGVSGTNAHVILEEAPAEEPSPTAAEGDGPEPVVPWVLSAKTPDALAELAGRLRDHVERDPELTPTEVGGALLRRTRLERRAVVIGSDRAELLRGLDALTTNTPDRSLVTGTPTTTGKLAFVFPGQGTQWPGMGAGLLDTDPVFTHTIHEIEEALAPYCDWKLTDVIRQTPNAPTLDRVDVVQPTSFALMTALARLWQHHDIHP
ncbi:AMP-binding protein, partial [Streptomyces sp. NPDC048106]|uniref:AMP-binding protein n=1 Tax=Streptomyces sp. NPDC048106 TaxID=3155750 RepID=UPI0034543ED7